MFPLLVGATFLLIGIAIPSSSSTWFNLRTPWTRASEPVRDRTRRLTGHSMVGAGVVMIVGGVTLPAEFGLPVVIGAVVAAIAGPVIYSYLTSRREPGE